MTGLPLTRRELAALLGDVEQLTTLSLRLKRDNDALRQELAELRVQPRPVRDADARLARSGSSSAREAI